MCQGRIDGPFGPRVAWKEALQREVGGGARLEGRKCGHVGGQDAEVGKWLGAACQTRRGDVVAGYGAAGQAGRGGDANQGVGVGRRT